MRYRVGVSILDLRELFECILHDCVRYFGNLQIISVVVSYRMLGSILEGTDICTD